MGTEKEILILNDGSQYENWGIKACIDGLKYILDIPRSCIKGLDHSFMHRRYSFEPKLFGRKVLNPDGRVARRFLTEFHTLPRIVDEFEYVAELWNKGLAGKGSRYFIERARSAEMVVFNAEGSTYRGNHGAINGLFMLWFAKKYLGKKTCFLNGSVTLTAVDAILPGMVRKVFNEVDMVGVREPVSQKNIVGIFPELESKVFMFPDSVFALENPNGDQIQKQNTVKLPEEYCAFSLSMLPMDFRRSTEHSSLIALIHKLKEVVPNVVLLAKDVEDRGIEKVAELTGSFYIGHEYAYTDVMGVFSRARFLVSGRYHHLIFATQMGCPVIPMSTSSHKIHGLAELFPGLMNKPVDPTDLWSEMETIINTAHKIVGQGDVLRDQYRERARQLGRDSLMQQHVLKELFETEV